MASGSIFRCPWGAAGGNMVDHRSRVMSESEMTASPAIGSIPGNVFNEQETSCWHIASGQS